MAERGAEGVAINEITEAADVGFGSFYNHFESKDAIYAAVVESLFGEFADWLDQLSAGIDDPAEVVALAVRHTVARAQREPLWGRFLIREGLSPGAIERGLGRRLIRDIRNGIQSRRFPNTDEFMAFAAVAGTVLFAVNATTDETARASQFKHWPERTAATALRILGLAQETAEDIAYRPLPQPKSAAP